MAPRSYICFVQALVLLHSPSEGGFQAGYHFSTLVNRSRLGMILCHGYQDSQHVYYRLLVLQLC